MFSSVIDNQETVSLFCTSSSVASGLFECFFATGTVTEVEKVTTEVAAKLQKEFSEQCANVMKVRGHHKLQMETVKSKNGKEMKFDFSYGWPTRYYCVCNTSSETVTKDVITKFEVWVCPSPKW